MVTFHIRECLHKNRVKPITAVTWEGKTYLAVGQGSAADCAVLLRGADCPDVAWVAVDAAQEVLFRGASLHKLASVAPDNPPVDGLQVVARAA